MIYSLLLTALVIAAAAWAASRTGPRLILAIALLAYGAASINPLIEAVVFEVMPILETPPALIFHFIFISVLSALAVVAFRKATNNHLPALVPRYTLARLLAVGAIYTLLYFTAGAFVFPYVKDFYANKRLPPMSLLFGLQMIRGPLYAFFAWPYLRLADRQSGLILALMYSVVGGVAPLLVDNNPYMPREVRLPHLVEVGASNFIFGWITAKLLQAPADQPPQ